MMGVAGRRLRVGQWAATPAESRPGNGRDATAPPRPLVVLSGIGMNMELLEPVIAAMPERRVISFDMPGIGQSPDPVFPYTIPCMALALAALLDRLHIDSADVLGISWGGTVAQQFAFQHRARVGRLVLAATTAGATMVPGSPSLLSRLADPVEYTMSRTFRRNLAMLYNGGGHQAVSLNAALPPSPVGWAYQLGAFVGWTSLPFLPLLSVPTLVLHDADDHLIPLANAQFLHSAIPGSEMSEFAGGGHLFMLADPEGFATRVRGFLDRV